MAGIKRVTADSATRERRRRGITILELLVVCGVVSLLVALLLPAIEQSRESARRLQCISRLRQIGLAMQTHHDVYGQLPSGWSPTADSRFEPAWGMRLLSQLGVPPLEAGIFRESPSGVTTITEPRLGLFQCPSDVVPELVDVYQESGHHAAMTGVPDVLLSRFPSANYVAVFGTVDPDADPPQNADGAFYRNSRTRLNDLERGTSQTLLVGERTAKRLPSTWVCVDPQGEEGNSRVVGMASKGPKRSDAEECEFDSRHHGMTNFLWADGHVSGVGDQIDAAVYRASARRSSNGD